ncbi:MAG: serine protease SohB [Candidatus Azotimanducaceae bacterium]|jgi:serine protease SohB
MEYLYDYLTFLAQAITIVVAILIIVSAIFGMSHRSVDHEPIGRLRIDKVNDHLRSMRHTMEAAVLTDGQFKKQHKAEAKLEKKTNKSAPKEPQASTNGRLFCLNFEGDIKASGVDRLREEITSILTLAQPTDEVLVAIESPGGMVSNYGLAASQLTRITDKNITLTVAVDKVAASGGYLMAVVADKIIAAPFALVGSIGVVAQVPNVHRLLKKNDVDVEILTAGKHKRTLTTLGENTEEGRQKFQEELEDVHNLFQEFVSRYRPAIDIDTVATGEAWYGTRAIDLGLVDSLATSDDYIVQACAERDVYAVRWDEIRKPFDRLMERVNGIAKQVEMTVAKFTASDKPLG